MEKLKRLLKKDATLIIIMSLFIMIIYQFSYKGFITLAICAFGISLMKLIELYYKKNNKTIPEGRATILFLSFTLLPTAFNDDITKYFIYKGEHQKICETIHQIEQSSLFDDYFYLTNHDIKFNLNQYKKAKIDDKVCITFNPNQKWLGYAYIFKVEKQ